MPVKKKVIKKIRRVTKTKDVCTHEHNFFHELFCHHIHKHGHKLIRLTHKYNHHAIHLGELLIVGFLCISHFISSGFAANTGTTLLTDHTLVAINLLNAEKAGKPRPNDPKIISMRMMNSSVENSFYPGYCTYGAALISPEFFPYSGTNTQIRTWGGNAKDRCANAQATGYSIGSTPVEGALIVYGKIGNSTLFGHVGKVMYYNNSQKTLIVRDMNRVGKFTMTDRRDTTDNTSIACYIYNKKSTTTIIPPIIPTNTGIVIVNTGTVIVNTGTTTPIIPIVTPPTTPTTPTTPTNTGTTTPPVIVVTPPPVTPPTTPTLPIGQYTTNNITLNFDNITDMAKHFLTQRNIEAKLSSKEKFKVGETATLTLTIKDINTQAGFEGLLDLPFELIASNDNIETSYSLIQLIKDGKIDIIITAKNIGDTTLLINFDGEKIGKIDFTVSS